MVLPISDLISQLSATETPNLKSGAPEIQQGRRNSKAAKRSFPQLKKQEVDDDFVVLSPAPPESVKASSSHFSLELCCTPTQRGVVVHMVYNTGTCTDAQAADMLAQYHQVLELALFASTEDPERVLYKAGPADVRNFQESNAAAPHASEYLAHGLVAKRTCTQPNAAAVHTWDGGLSYQVLNVITSKPAVELQKTGFGFEVIVLLRFEKSKWAVVAVLALCKAGAVFVFIDTEAPP